MRISTPADVQQLGTILSVWAHPDDESLLAGGLLAAAVRNGQQVICVTATRGEGGVQDESRWPAARLNDIRSKELQAALKVLGISAHHWLDYPDSGCDQVPEEEGTRKVTEFIEKYHPNTILTFGSEGLTGHPDHQAVSGWVTRAVNGIKNKPIIFRSVFEPTQYKKFLKPLDERINMFFNIDKPPLVSGIDCDIALELPKELLAQKIQALAAMPSQMERLLALVPQEARVGTLGHEYFVRAN